MKKSVFVSQLVAALMLASAYAPRCAQAAEVISSALTLSPAEITVAADGLVDVRMTGYDVHAEPARPTLPRKVMYFALPAGVDASTVKVVLDQADAKTVAVPAAIRPGSPMRPSNGGDVVDFGDATSVANGFDTSIYGQSVAYPESPVQILGFPGLRGYKLAQVAVNPVQYVPGTSTLKVYSSLSFHLEYAALPVAPASGSTIDAGMRSELMSLIENDTQASAWYGAPAPATVAASPGYYIITTDAIFAEAPSLYGFIPHKQNRGFDVHVVTETGIDGNAALTGWNEVTGQSPNDRADRIRQWLKNNYVARGIRYVLLVGNPTPDTGDVPMKMCWPRYDVTDYRETPTDYYFADMTGNWDKDGDGIYGEERGDEGTGGVDMIAELYVGRIPVYPGTGWQSALNGIVQKFIRYENETSIAWRKKALLPESFLDVNTDEANVGEAMRTNYLATAGYGAYTMYEQGTCSTSLNSKFTSNAELMDRSVVNHWKSNAYGLLMWMGHGWSEGAACCNGSIFTSAHATEMGNANPSIVYMGSCTCGYPESPNNVAYMTLKNGAIASLGATRVSWYAGVWLPHMSHPDIAGIGYHIFRNIVSNDLPFGEAVYQVMGTLGGGAANGWWMNRMDFGLYGDPSMKITASAPDTDGDGMSDSWETMYGLNPNDSSDAALDSDGDGLSNLQESTKNTNPRLSDTDYDGINDAQDSDPLTPAYILISLPADLVGGLSANVGGSAASWIPGYCQWGADRYNQYSGILGFNLSTISDKAVIRGVTLRYQNNGPGWGYASRIIGLGDINPQTQPLPAFMSITTNTPLVTATAAQFPRVYNNTGALNLGASAASDVNSRLAADRWTMGIGFTHQGNTTAIIITNASLMVSYEVYRSSYDSITVAGTFNGWNQNLANMKLVADYTWEMSVKLTNATGNRFKFVGNKSWTINWGESNQSGFALPLNGIAERGNFADVVVNGTLNGTYKFTFDERTGAYTVAYLPPPDTDHDGMPDDWETQNGLNPNDASDASGNPDGDIFTNLQEYQNGTNPRVWNRPASDFANITVSGTFNGWNIAATNLVLVDNYVWQWDATMAAQSAVRFKFVANGSWTVNWGESNQTDLDLPVDALAERGNFGDIKLNDTLTGSYRFTFNERTGAYKVEKLVVDTDHDGMPDDWETANKLNPSSNADAALDGDADTLTNLQEYQRGTNPWRSDTDLDGISDASDSQPTIAAFQQIQANPAIIGTIIRYGGFDVPTYTYSFSTGSVYYSAHYRDYEKERSFIRFDLSGLPAGAIVKHAVMLYDLTGSPSEAFDYRLAAMGTQDPRTAAGASNAFFAAESAASYQGVISAYARNSGIQEALALSPVMQADIQSRPASSYWSAGIYNDLNSYNAIWANLTNLKLVVSYTAPKSDFQSMTAAGTFNGWNQSAKNMRLIADYTWQFETVLNNATGFRFKFVANESWGINWGEQNQGDFDAPIEGNAERGNFGDITMNGTLNGTFRFTFNERTGAYKVEFVPPADTDSDGMPDYWENQYGLNPNDAMDAAQDPDIDGFTNLQEYRNGTSPIAWDRMKSDYSSISVPGTYNNWSLSAYKMRLVDNYIWSLDLNFFSSGTIEVKFVANESWSVNWGEQNQSDFTAPLSQYAEKGNFANIRFDGPFSGYYVLTFDERTGAYSFGLKP